MNSNRDMSITEYIEHINLIQKVFPGKAMLLLQQNDKLLGRSLFSFYLETLQFTKFCVGSLAQAKELKEYNSDFEIIGSITMKITEQELNNPEYQKYFDGFVLFFPFNKDIERVKQLPKCFKYIVLTNCSCNLNCDCTHHWFASQEEEKNLICPNQITPPEFKDIGLIRPIDMDIWEQYIDIFKLQGREYDTPRIIRDLILYNENYQYF